MAIVFSCVQCSQELQTVNEHAGRKVSCRHCRAVNTVPAAPVEPSLDLTDETSHRRASPPPLPLPSREESRPGEMLDERERRDRKRDRSRRERDDRDRRDPPRTGGSAFGLMVIGGIVVGLVVLAIGGGIGFAMLYSRARPIHLDPNGNKFGHEPINPVTTLPIQDVELVNGKADIEVNFNNQKPPASQVWCRPHRVTLQAGKIYWIRTTSTGRVMVNKPELEVVGPGEKMAPVSVVNLRQNSDQQVLVVRNTAEYQVIVIHRFNDPVPIRLVIQEMDGSEPLPPELRFRSKNVDLPSITEHAGANGDLWGASGAFSSDSRTLLVSQWNGVTRCWVDGKLKGSFGNPGNVVAKVLLQLSFDHKGRVYAQQVINDITQPHSHTQPVGDIHVWDSLVPREQGVPLPPPSRTLPLKGVVASMIASPDGKFVYFLDTHNRKVGRIHADDGKIDRELDTISAGPVAMCMTADGKRLYCCSTSGKIDVIDTATFKLLASVKHDATSPISIAATNSGVVYLVSRRDEATRLGVVHMMDLQQGLPDSVKAISFSRAYDPKDVLVLPDQRGVLVVDIQLAMYSIPKRPTLDAVEHKNIKMLHHAPHRANAISPDGRTAFISGTRLLSIGR